MTIARPPYLRGDRAPMGDRARMIRVDQAGEYGATRIYQGQLAVLRRGRGAAAVGEMAAQEERHLAQFDRLVRERRARPTALSPLWHVAGYALGAATALLGERAAMACTVAVEEAIDAHYAAQEERLEDEPALRETVARFRAEENEHREIGLAHGAEQAPGYRVLSAMIKAGCRAAIRISERL